MGPSATGTTLVLTQSPDTVTHRAGSIVDVSDVLSSFSEADLDQVYKVLSNQERDRETWPPVYELAWPRLSVPFEPTIGPDPALTHRILLYRWLEDRVREENVSRIVCAELPVKYRVVAVDVANALGIEVEATVPGPRRQALTGYLLGLVGIFVLLVDQLFAMVWYSGTDGPGDTDTVFVPHLNRLESMEPVIEAASGRYRVLTVRPTVERISARWSDDGRILEQEPTVDIHRFVTARVLWSELKLLAFGFPYEILVARRTNDFLEGLIEREFDAEMPSTVAHALGTVYRDGPSWLYLLTAARALDELDPDDVVVGSAGAKQLAVVEAAGEAGIDTHHVPHTATTGYEVIPQGGTTHFVPGPVAVDHLRQSDQLDGLDDIRALGRPYFEQIPTPQTRADVSLPATITVLTQPFADDVRRTLVESVLGSLAASDFDAEVVIKIHPRESPEFYDDIVSETDITTTVRADALFETIEQSDLAVVINSNTGVESMLLGTPIVCVNYWTPVIRTRPYAEHGPVPVFGHEEELARFFEDCTSDTVIQLRDEQLAYAEENYRSDDAAASIARYVQGHQHQNE